MLSVTCETGGPWRTHRRRVAVTKFVLVLHVGSFGAPQGTESPAQPIAAVHFWHCGNGAWLSTTATKRCRARCVNELQLR